MAHIKLAKRDVFKSRDDYIVVRDATDDSESEHLSYSLTYLKYFKDETTKPLVFNGKHIELNNKTYKYYLISAYNRIDGIDMLDITHLVK